MKKCMLGAALLIFTHIIHSQKVIPSLELTIVNESGLDYRYYNNELFSGYSVQYQKNDKPISWITYKDGQADGKWQEWYENGQLKFDSHWKKGKGHGAWTYYHQNGEVRQEEFYDMDIPLGVFKDYWPNGNLRLLSSWVDGLKDGRWLYFNETGELIKEETYVNGVLGTENN